MLKRSLLQMLLLTAVLGSSAVAGEVVIKTNGADRQVKTAAYEATVNAVGKLVKLSVGGRVLADSLYFYHGGIPDMRVESVSGNVIAVRGDKSAAKFTFGDEAIDFELTNLTAKMTQYVIVFSPAVEAVMNGQGEFFKTTVNSNWDTTIWFCGGVKLAVSSTKTRQWGPFANKHQVWTTNIESNGSRTIRFEIGKTSPEETAKVAAASKQAANPPKKQLPPVQKKAN